MQPEFIAVSPHTPLLTVHKLFVEKQIHGAPVIDDRDEAVGVVSALDLLRAIRTELEPGRSSRTTSYFIDDTAQKIDALDVSESDRLWRLTVGDVMSTAIVAVEPGVPISAVARTMIDRRVHRVLVMSDHRVRGVLTTFDLLSAIADPLAHRPARRTDYSR